MGILLLFCINSNRCYKKYYKVGNKRQINHILLPVKS